MHNFKTGDRVKCIKDLDNNELAVGKIGVVKESWDDGVTVRFSRNEVRYPFTEWNFYEDPIEDYLIPVEFRGN